MSICNSKLDKNKMGILKVLNDLIEEVEVNGNASRLEEVTKIFQNDECMGNW
jgi:hypothetical protein